MKKLTNAQSAELLKTLQSRFEKHMPRHKGLEWSAVADRLKKFPDKLRSLYEMEQTGGEPDVVGVNKSTGAYIFFDCAAESPAGRRSLCYDRAALDSRKEFKPVNSAVEMAATMNAELMNEEDYRRLQQLGKFDSKTSSWLNTPAAIRKLGGAIFGDYRYGTVFIYHNGASSYYAARGFRCSLTV